jgi:S1-C subfamily serine protease
VIGINSQIESTGGGGEGVGFAVPVDTARRSLAQLRAHGHVEYAYLGVSAQELYPQLARRLRLATRDGALVTRVEPGGPAADAGIAAGGDKITFEGEDGVPQGGDAIVAIDGHRVRHSADLTDIVGMRSPGDRVALAVVRGAKRRTVHVTLAARPERSTRGLLKP